MHATHARLALQLASAHCLAGGPWRALPLLRAWTARAPSSVTSLGGAMASLAAEGQVAAASASTGATLKDMEGRLGSLSHAPTVSAIPSHSTPLFLWIFSSELGRAPSLYVPIRPRRSPPPPRWSSSSPAPLAWARTP